MKLRTIRRFAFFFIALFLLLVLGKNKFISFTTQISTLITQYSHGKHHPDKIHQKSNNQLKSRIEETLHELEVKEDEISSHFFLENRRYEITTSIPQGRPVEWVVWKLYECTKGTTYHVSDCFFTTKKNIYTITYTSDTPQKEKIILFFSFSGKFLSYSAKIAFLIQDFNFEADQTTIDFLSFPEPLTISLVPSLKKSSWTAQAADEYNKEIIIQLPFEPQSNKNILPSESIIMLHYPDETIRDIISLAVKNIPNFAGFTNLSGALVLEDSRVMTVIFSEIKKNHGYFINTYTRNKSVVSAIAEKKAIPYQEITTTITSTNDITAIEEQLKHYAVVALKRNNLLIAASASTTFIQALKNVLPVFKLHGIRLVHVSEVLNHPSDK